MVKPKIIIVGGGIGGLSCATALAETGRFDVSIYESNIIGGQASSKNSEKCNTEISWRIVGESYANFKKILIDLDILKNLYPLHKSDACINNKLLSPAFHPLLAAFQNCNYQQINKMIQVLFLSKERAINEYHDVVASDYYKSYLMDIVVGPYFGLEPQKVTLSAFYKNLFGVHNKTYGPKFIHVTKYPTNDSIFNPWRDYLESKGVKIYEYKQLNSIITNKKGHITHLNIDNTVFKPNEIVLACSVSSLYKIFKKNTTLVRNPIIHKLNKLQDGNQFYISVNFYWKKPIIKNRECHIYTFVDGWMPIILKRFINTNYVKENCKDEIKEVWNIGVADYLLGNYVKKYTSQCTFEEIVYEIKMNLINSEHFKDYLDLQNNSWEDLFYDYEFDDRYYKKTPNTLKFSINEGIEKNLLNNKETSLGDNVYFSAFYVKNTVGGASMETSCEIGLTTADLICKKYNIVSPRKPVYKTNTTITPLTYPFVKLDSLLYKLNLPPITDYIHPVILLISYLVIILAIGIYLIKAIVTKVKSNKLSNSRTNKVKKKGKPKKSKVKKFKV